MLINSNFVWNFIDFEDGNLKPLDDDDEALSLLDYLRFG